MLLQGADGDGIGVGVALNACAFVSARGGLCVIERVVCVTPREGVGGGWRCGASLIIIHV